MKLATVFVLRVKQIYKKPLKISENLWKTKVCHIDLFSKFCLRPKIFVNKNNIGQRQTINTRLDNIFKTVNAMPRPF